MFNPHALVKDDKSTVVVLLDPSLPPNASFQAVQWPDPAGGTGSDRLYLLQESETTASDSTRNTTATICEIQSFASDYASYLVPGDDSSLVIGRRSDLLCVTPVDPLYFLLAQQACPAPNNNNTTTIKLPWQPLDQLWAAMSSSRGTTETSTGEGHDAPSLESIILQPHITNQALAQWYDSMDIDADTVVYKFVPERALDWLSRKHQAVQTVLEQQAAKHKTNANTGAFDSSFAILSSDINRTTQQQQQAVVSPGSSQESTSMTMPTPVDATVRRESLQLVCSYLSEAWRLAFLSHIGESLESLDTAATTMKKRRVTVDGEGGGGGVDASAVSAAANLAYMTTGQGVNATGKSSSLAGSSQSTKLTLQQKKLSKVNTKGMNKISSFFRAGAAKKK